tara:strand:- start:115 stop:264 length:150 start_codon:yes stop_codon:yes gene_type:complete
MSLIYKLLKLIENKNKTSLIIFIIISLMVYTFYYSINIETANPFIYFDF